MGDPEVAADRRNSKHGTRTGQEEIERAGVDLFGTSLTVFVHCPEVVRDRSVWLYEPFVQCIWVIGFPSEGKNVLRDQITERQIGLTGG
jgi:hypothetical protein